MLPLARLGDLTTGYCSTHTPGGHTTTGIVIGASQNITVEGCIQARLGDIVLADCGSIGVICSGSGKVFMNGLPAARIGDSFTGTYSGTIINGASKVYGI